MKKLLQMLFGWIPGVMSSKQIPFALDKNVLDALPSVKRVVIYQKHPNNYIKEDIAKTPDLPLVQWCHSPHELVLLSHVTKDPFIVIMGLVHSKEASMKRIIKRVAITDGRPLFWYSMLDYKKAVDRSQWPLFKGTIKKGDFGDELISFLQAIPK